MLFTVALHPTQSQEHSIGGAAIRVRTLIIFDGVVRNYKGFEVRRDEKNFKLQIGFRSTSLSIYWIFLEFKKPKLKKLSSLLTAAEHALTASYLGKTTTIIHTESFVK